MFSLHKLRNIANIDLLRALIVYCLLEFLFVNFNRYFLWIPDELQLLIPGTIIGLFILKKIVKILFFAVLAPLVFKLFTFVIYFQIGFAPLHMEIVVYLSMVGLAFVGALLGYLLRKMLVSSNTFSKKQGL